MCLDFDGEKTTALTREELLNTISYREVKRFIKISALQTKANMSSWFYKNTFDF